MHWCEINLARPVILIAPISSVTGRIKSHACFCIFAWPSALAIPPPTPSHLDTLEPRILSPMLRAPWGTPTSLWSLTCFSPNHATTGSACQREFQIGVYFTPYGSEASEPVVVNLWVATYDRRSRRSRFVWYRCASDGWRYFLHDLYVALGGTDASREESECFSANTRRLHLEIIRCLFESLCLFLFAC